MIPFVPDNKQYLEPLGGLMVAIKLLLVVCIVLTTGSSAIYQPNWESLDARPLPAWYDESKFGIFIHWGVFSVPSFGSEWFWIRWANKDPLIVDFMKKNYPPGFSYPEFAPKFTAEFFDPNQWADILAASGARYVVFTSKHAEGFCNWKTNVSWNWNSVDIGPHRDLVGDLANAIRSRTKLHFGIYHALAEWFNPLWQEDKANNFTTQSFVREKTIPALHELVNTYKPEIIWSDHPSGSDTYFNSTNFLAWLYNESPVKDIVVTDDRWGSHLEGKHGGFYTRPPPGTHLTHKWENYMKIEKKSWGYRRNAKLADYHPTEFLIEKLVHTVSNGGNMLLNIGPTRSGVITPIFEERLRDMGSWLNVNGEAIYGSKPWKHQNDTIAAKTVWYTSQKTLKDTTVYAILVKWPKGNALVLGSTNASPQTTVFLLGYKQALKWSSKPGGGMVITLPTLSIRELPCQWAWTLKISNLT